MTTKRNKKIKNKMNNKTKNRMKGFKKQRKDLKNKEENMTKSKKGPSIKHLKIWMKMSLTPFVSSTA
jgi:hypothetical protein